MATVLVIVLLLSSYPERSFLPAQAKLMDHQEYQKADSNGPYKERTSICPLPEKGVYKIASLSCPEKTLDVSGSGKQNGANVQLWEPNATQGQKWLIEHVEELNKHCFYKVVALHSGKVLEVISSGKENGVNVYQWEWSDTDKQKWRIERLAEKNQPYYKLTAKHSGKVLDVSQSLCQNGANVQQWSSNQSDAQKWRLIPVDLKKAFYGDTENRDLKRKMTPERFEHLKQQISDANFDDEKQKLLLSAAQLRILSSDQVAELIKVLDFDNHRLSLSKRIYPYVLDPENYFAVVRALVFENHRKELRDFLEVTNP